MQKTLFKQIFLITAIVLSVLPVLVTFGSLLTTLFNSMGWYVWLQNAVVPFESRLVAVIIRLFGIRGLVTQSTDYSIVLEKPGGGYLPVAMEWNCLGWQSMILLGITLFVGLRGSYRLGSKLEVLVIGILGTFLSNLVRMSIIVTLAYYVNELAAKIIHDYFAMFVSLIWIIFFWWFSYSYVLDEKA